MEKLVKRVRNISRKNNYNLTDPIEQYYRLITNLVNYEYAYMNHNEELQGKNIGELMFDLIMLCYTLDIDFYELYEGVDTFIYPIEDLDTIHMGALILNIVNNPDNDKEKSYLKNHIIFFIEALATETVYLPAEITVKIALENLLEGIENNAITILRDESYLNYLQNIGMNS